MSTVLPGITVGAVLPSVAPPVIDRATLAAFAAASGDHNPVHLDAEAARAVGRDDVIAHGMLLMAYLGRTLTALVPQSAVRSFSARFVAVTPVDARPTCTGKVTAIEVVHGEQRARLELTVALEDGSVTVRGQAIVALTGLS